VRLLDVPDVRDRLARPILADLEAPVLVVADLLQLPDRDVLLMSDDVARIPPMLALARRRPRGHSPEPGRGGVVVLVALVLALVGVLPLSLGVVVHEGSMLVVVPNGLRLLARHG
jgi:hypothetical protein